MTFNGRKGKGLRRAVCGAASVGGGVGFYSFSLLLAGRRGEGGVLVARGLRRVFKFWGLGWVGVGLFVNPAICVFFGKV